MLTLLALPCWEELQELAEEEPPAQEGRLSWDKWPDFLLCKWEIYF